MAQMLVSIAAWLLTAGSATAQPGSATLRVLIQDDTRVALPHAVVTLTDAVGTASSEPTDGAGLSVFDGLSPGEFVIRVEAEGFQTLRRRLTVQRGLSSETVILSVELKAKVSINVTDPGEARDHGFSRTLTPDEVSALPDDPDDMKQQLKDLAGPGAEIFVDGFRAGRLPPKDQILQICFQTNSFAAECHDAGMVRIEIISKPGMGAWRGAGSVGFRDDALDGRNAFALTRGAERPQRYMANFARRLRQ